MVPPFCVALGNAAASPMAWALFVLVMGLPLWRVGFGLLRHIGGVQQLGSHSARLSWGHANGGAGAAVAGMAVQHNRAAGFIAPDFNGPAWGMGAAQVYGVGACAGEGSHAAPPSSLANRRSAARC